jgi:hypothetical protein
VGFIERLSNGEGHIIESEYRGIHMRIPLPINASCNSLDRHFCRLSSYNLDINILALNPSILLVVACDHYMVDSGTIQIHERLKSLKLLYHSY